MTRFRSLIRIARRFGRDRRANIAMTFALALPVALGLGAVGLDYTMMSADRAKLQTAADVAALNSARELQFANVDQAKVVAVANNYVQQSLTNAALNAAPAVSVAILNSNTSMQVTLTETFTPQFSGFMAQGSYTLQVNATARIANGMPICLIGLDSGHTKGTVHLEAQARLQAPGCAIYSNSSHPWGFESKDVALVTAGLICSHGGKFGGTQNFNPQPMTDCPVVPDPLAARPGASFGSCNYYNKVIASQIAVLSPGVYCGGLSITGTSNVTMSPGNYIIKDGPLNIADTTQLQGTNVGFYLTGTGSVFTFATGTTINLTAPKTGDLAGFLIFEDRTVSGNVHQILSDNARQLLGTIYLPNSSLQVQTSQPVADQSAYTVIVALHMELYAGPTLVMNTNYNGTDVPVPQGVGPVGGKVTLTN